MTSGICLWYLKLYWETIKSLNRNLDYNSAHKQRPAQRYDSPSTMQGQEAEIISWQVTLKEFLPDIEICTTLQISLYILKRFFLKWI